MSGHRWFIAETHEGPVSLIVDGVPFTCHSVELRRVPKDEEISPKLDLVVRPEGLVEEYEIVLRVRPDENRIAVTRVDSP